VDYLKAVLVKDDGEGAKVTNVSRHSNICNNEAVRIREELLRAGLIQYTEPYRAGMFARRNLKLTQNGLHYLISVKQLNEKLFDGSLVISN
jgi:predicted transcriptional regulator